MLFDVQMTTRGSATVLTVIGDVDLASLPRLAAALDNVGSIEPIASEPATAKSGPAARVIDLRSVDWFDPMCLGVLLSADLKARRQGAALVVKAAGAVADLLAETGLDSVLEIES